MPLSLRLPPDKEAMIRKAASRAGKSKTSLIVEAVDEKLGLDKSSKELIREMASWLTHQEDEELRQSLKVFERTNEGNWN
jgi:hypothetical protein